MEQTNKRAKYESSYKCASYINLSLVAKKTCLPTAPCVHIFFDFMIIDKTLLIG
jgi:hypothetical protein